MGNNSITKFRNYDKFKTLNFEIPNNKFISNRRTVVHSWQELFRLSETESFSIESQGK